jgi:hypothetical protein
VTDQIRRLPKREDFDGGTLVATKSNTIINNNAQQDLLVAQQSPQGKPVAVVVASLSLYISAAFVVTLASSNQR